jgi:hypothetical protein
MAASSTQSSDAIPMEIEQPKDGDGDQMTDTPADAPVPLVDRVDDAVTTFLASHPAAETKQEVGDAKGKLKNLDAVLNTIVAHGSRIETRSGSEHKLSEEQKNGVVILYHASSWSQFCKLNSLRLATWQQNRVAEGKMVTVIMVSSDINDAEFKTHLTESKFELGISPNPELFKDVVVSPTIEVFYRSIEVKINFRSLLDVSFGDPILGRLLYNLVVP